VEDPQKPKTVGGKTGGNVLWRSKGADRSDRLRHTTVNCDIWFYMALSLLLKWTLCGYYSLFILTVTQSWQKDTRISFSESILH